MNVANGPKAILGGALSVLMCALPAADVRAQIMIDFSEFGPSPFSLVDDFYAGGVNEDGVQGPDFGVVFESAFATPESDGNYFASWDDGFFGPLDITVAGGFSDRLAFRYGAIGLLEADLWVSIYGADSVLLARETIVLPGAADPLDIEWFDLAIEFTGTAERVVIVDGCLFFCVAVDDFVIGRPVPLPASGWLLLAAMSVGGAIRVSGMSQRRRR